MNIQELQVVYGGQWGSEGKGRVCVYLAQQRQTPWLYAVRVGGPNAGHTIEDVGGRTLKLQQIPVAAFASSKVVPIIGPSGMILPEILESELVLLQDTWKKADNTKPPVLLIDEQATVILPEHMAKEADLKTSIGSTGEGVGAASADRVMRKAMTFREYFANMTPQHRSWWSGRVMFVDSQDYITSRTHGVTVQIEGTQGYLLSLNAGRYYPYCTSRDCGPEAIVSQCGLNLRMADKVRVICVMRTYPIRVGGNSGPMGDEVDWDYMSESTDGYITTPERTTVTNKIRRIALWSKHTAARVGRETRPTEVALTFADYMWPYLATGWSKYGKTALEQARYKDQELATAMAGLESFIISVEEQVQAPVTMASVGPGHILQRWTPINLHPKHSSPMPDIRPIPQEDPNAQ